MELREKRYMSKKDFGEDRTNVGYALYVRENLKPNDYFKCNTGEIFKSMTISPIPNGKVYYANGDYSWVSELAIVNFSPNLIDLIEVGDYVNGFKITEISISGKVLFYQDYDIVKSIENNSIKSIVTHEQFESISYKVGE